MPFPCLPMAFSLLILSVPTTAFKFPVPITILCDGKFSTSAWRLSANDKCRGNHYGLKAKLFHHGLCSLWTESRPSAFTDKTTSTKHRPYIPESNFPIILWCSGLAVSQWQLPVGFPRCILACEGSEGPCQPIDSTVSCWCFREGDVVNLTPNCPAD